MAPLPTAKQRVRTVHRSAFLRQEPEVTPYLRLPQVNERLGHECHHLASLSPDFPEPSQFLSGILFHITDVRVAHFHLLLFWKASPHVPVPTGGP